MSYVSIKKNTPLKTEISSLKQSCYQGGLASRVCDQGRAVSPDRVPVPRRALTWFHVVLSCLQITLLLNLNFASEVSWDSGTLRERTDLLSGSSPRWGCSSSGMRVRKIKPTEQPTAPAQAADLAYRCVSWSSVGCYGVSSTWPGQDLGSDL